MVDKNKVLDEAVRRERKAKIKKTLTYTMLALVFGGIFSFSVFQNYDRVKFSKEFSGVVQSIKKSKDTQDQSVLKIKLQTNKIIEIPVNRFASLATGDEIKVLRQTLESGQTRYTVVLN
ncbi:MAG TPA: hypothetical protein ENK06_02720 [Gammaproteobacteria bacterium]|nr:hypothetical protein [Gammaproteobacteria bacterium]